MVEYLAINISGKNLKSRLCSELLRKKIKIINVTFTVENNLANQKKKKKSLSDLALYSKEL